MTREAGDCVDVLLIEDDPGDALMIKESFEHAKADIRLHTVPGGADALRFLRQAHEFTGAPRPGLILLDLALPDRRGLDVLAELKTDQDLMTIPVIVLSSSLDKQDIHRSYELHANAYISKPPDFDGYAEVIWQIDACFLSLIKLPN
jgi:CheY-like chemotaxis protein